MRSSLKEVIRGFPGEGFREGANRAKYFYDGNGNVTEVLQPSVDFSALAGLDACDYFTQMLSATTFLCDPTGADSSSANPEMEPDGLSAGVGQMAAATGGGGGPPAWLLTHYEYDPYGNILYSYGSYANVNPFRFSTKWVDTEPGSGKEQYYFGYRYYSPRLGRWLSRDPGDEEESDAANPYNLTEWSLSSPLLARSSEIGLMLTQQASVRIDRGETKCDKMTGKPKSRVYSEYCGDSKCAARHEQIHNDDLASCCYRYYLCRTRMKNDEYCKERYSEWVYANYYYFECRAYRDTRNCLQSHLFWACGVFGSCGCCKQVQDAATDAKNARDFACARATRRFRCPFDKNGTWRNRVHFGELPPKLPPGAIIEE